MRNIYIRELLFLEYSTIFLKNQKNHEVLNYSRGAGSHEELKLVVGANVYA
jgi:hypothetical protein